MCHAGLILCQTPERHQEFYTVMKVVKFLELCKSVSKAVLHFVELQTVQERSRNGVTSRKT